MRTELKRSGGGRCGGAGTAGEAEGGATAVAAGRSGVRGGSAAAGEGAAAVAEAASASGPIQRDTDAQPRRTTAREPPPSSGVSACTETSKPGP